MSNRTYNYTSGKPGAGQFGASAEIRAELTAISAGVAAIEAEIDLKAAKAGDTHTGTHNFTGAVVTVAAPAADAQAATKKYVDDQLTAGLAPKAIKGGDTYTGTHNFTGATVTVPTATVGDSSTKAASTKFVDDLVTATAFTTILPGQPGNAGKFVTTDGTNASWAVVGISNIVTATTATTLTSTPTLLQITPASYGVAVTLPDATTCAEGGPVHIIDNKGAYPVRVLNNSGTLLGFIFGGVVSHISLVDNSSAAGTWTVENGELVGASAQLLTTNILSVESVVALDADRDFMLSKGGSNYSYGTVYNKTTNTWGTPTAIRSAAVTGKHAAIKSATDQILVVSCTSGADAFEAVVLTISGTGITVGTAATATLSANISAFADGCALIQVGTSFITSYTVATPAAQIREITISGTTPTVSDATVLDGTAGGLIVAGSATVVLAESYTATHHYVCPYSIGGLTKGTTYDDTTSVNYAVNLFAPLGTRWALVYPDNGKLLGCIISLSVTTATGTTAELFASASYADAIVVGGKLLVMNTQTSNNANLLTDNAGTAVAGTAITLSAATTRACLYADGNSVVVQEGTTTYMVQMVDCSGASPVKTKTSYGKVSNTEVLVFYPSNSMLGRSPNALYGAAFAQTALVTSTTTNNFQYRVKNGVSSQIPIKQYAFEGNTELAAYRGASDSERWVGDGATVITKIECVP